MNEFERNLIGPVNSDLEPKPKSDGLHVNSAVALGGRMTWQYAWDLSAGFAGRDYVARALLARGLPADAVKDLVVEVFAERKRDYYRRGNRYIAIAVALLLLSAGLAFFTVQQGRFQNVDPVDLAMAGVRRCVFPAIFGAGLAIWGVGLRRRAARL